MAVALRQPTFKNPLPKMFKLLGKVLMTVFVGIIAFGESAGRARAAAELSRQGYHEEAKRLILREDLKDV
jgi:hypothetical protein